MPGLNFYTTTIINSKDRFKKVDKSEASDSTTPYVPEDELFVSQDFHFRKSNIDRVVRAEAYDAKMAKVEVDLTGIVDKAKGNDDDTLYARLDVYVKVVGADPFLYSNPWIQKGKPFWVEFTVDASDEELTDAKVAENLAAQINKIHMFQVDHDILTVTASGSKLVLEAKEEFLRFGDIKVVAFDTTMAQEKTLNSVKVEVVEAGKNSFGTFDQIQRDLRLPTLEATRWNGILMDERPVLNAKYNQYIITYTSDANNDHCGLMAVGQRLKSTTTHVFWVNQDIDSDFKTAIEGVHGSIDVDTKAE